MEDPAAILGCGEGSFFKLLVFLNAFDPAVDLQLCWISHRSSTHLQQDRVLVLARQGGVVLVLPGG